jgi:beta-glucosidase
MHFRVWVTVIICLLSGASACAQDFTFKQSHLPIEERIDKLLAQLTIKEKINQLQHHNPAIDRLQIPAFFWWNEGLHGVGRSGNASVFPQPIGLAATFNEKLVETIANAISDEARILHRKALERGISQSFGGLCFWSPNVNLFRDPRWGRGQETWGEDPGLTGTLGAAFVRGMQGSRPGYLKTAACAKHFAVHSGPEGSRHRFDAKPTQKDLWDSYLPAFERLVGEGVEAVMCAYNRLNGAPCCANDSLLTHILRDRWKFKGHIVTDCWAVEDFVTGHQVAKNKEDAAVMAIRAGVSLECGDAFPALLSAYQKKQISEAEIDQALRPLLRTKFKLGVLDQDPSAHPFGQVPDTLLNSSYHRSLARKSAAASMVLIQNKGDVLPMSNKLPRYFVTGPLATSTEVLLGNYHGVNQEMVTFLEGITRSVEIGSQVQYRPGIQLYQKNINPIDWATPEAKDADVTILVLGINGTLEGEEGEAILSAQSGDRDSYSLPPHQLAFLKKLATENRKPLICIVTGGSPIDLAEICQYADAVILSWYPGMEGGNALADILFGQVNPSGRLPITFPKTWSDLPPFDDYRMAGRTYRFMQKEPLFPFGYGLSYTTFAYSNMRMEKQANRLIVSAEISNTGPRTGTELVQLYHKQVSQLQVQQLRLLAFQPISLKAGESKTIKLSFDQQLIEQIDELLIPDSHAQQEQLILAPHAPMMGRWSNGQPSRFLMIDVDHTSAGLRKNRH